MNKHEHIIKDSFIANFNDQFDLLVPEKQMAQCSYNKTMLWYYSRCDLFGISNNNIVAIETKSQYDSLQRLESQVQNYYLNANKIIFYD